MASCGEFTFHLQSPIIELFSTIFNISFEHDLTYVSNTEFEVEYVIFLFYFSMFNILQIRERVPGKAESYTVYFYGTYET